MKKVQGTGADRPSSAHLFDAVKCENCVIAETCKIKENANRTGCRCGVEV